MPEGPEHHLAAKYVNDAVGNRIFGGQIEKSDVANNASKHPEVSWDGRRAYTIHASARGKEVKLSLTEVLSQNASKASTKRLPQILDIFFQFGMSGFYHFVAACSLPKHAHLRFFTKDNENCHVLCFVDPRRFGKWRVGGGWGTERGPDPIFEYDAFRSNIYENVKKSAFNHPICELLLNQQYFNGIGNYLRCEILYRANVAPFECARNVIESIIQNNDIKSEKPDILKLCSIIGEEVLNLSERRIYDPDVNGGYIIFKNWLQCYANPAMNKQLDHNGRTVWFSGIPGPLVPKGEKSRRNFKQPSSKVKPSKEKAKQPLKQTKKERSSTVKKSSTAASDSNTNNIQGRITRSKTRDKQHELNI